VCVFFCVRFLFFFFFFSFFETGFLCVALAVLELTLRPGWTQKSTCLYLPVLGLKACATTARLVSDFFHLAIAL
jgi:hypothetical protein